MSNAREIEDMHTKAATKRKYGEKLKLIVRYAAEFEPEFVENDELKLPLTVDFVRRLLFIICM